MSYARAIDIPTRLVMGFAAENTDCEVCGYHCWCESYISGLGWVPIDASCATKYHKEGLHGNLDLNHIAWSRGTRRKQERQTKHIGKDSLFLLFLFIRT